jgi:hypothetical protein
MLSDPFDNRDGNPVSWLGMDSLTPADRFFGFSHSAEEQHAIHLAEAGQGEAADERQPRGTEHGEPHAVM